MNAERTRGDRAGEGLAISLYFGDRDRAAGRPLADAALDLCAGHGLAAAALLRGLEGFGGGSLLEAERLLSLSDDLPLVAHGIGASPQVEALAAELAELAPQALLVLEPVRLAGAQLGDTGDPDEELKLVVFTGRRERRRGKAAHVAVVEALHEQGADGAISLLGVDGIAAGRRLRASALAANSWVPTLTVAAGKRGRIAAALAALAESEELPAATVRPLTVCRPADLALGPPPQPPASTAVSGARARLTLRCSASSQHEGRNIQQELVGRLRAAGADGATALGGIWGYDSDRQPHGDRLLGLRRRRPVAVEVIDTPERCRRWLAIAAELSGEVGLLSFEHGIFTLE